MIRDRLVLGCKDKAVRARLFRQKECTLKSALEAVRISEQTQEQLKQITMDQEGSASINAVQKGDAQSTKQKVSKAPARLRDVPLTIFAPACRNGSTHTTANRKECRVYVTNSASQCPRES